MQGVSGMWVKVQAFHPYSFSWQHHSFFYPYVDKSSSISSIQLQLAGS